MAERTESNHASPSQPDGNALRQLKSIHFKLVTTTQRLKEEVSRGVGSSEESNAANFSTLGESVTLLGGEFRAVVERTRPDERESVAVQKVLRDFQGVVRKAEALLKEGRRKQGNAIKCVGAAAIGLGRPADHNNGYVGQRMAEAGRENGVHDNDLLVQRQEQLQQKQQEEVVSQHAVDSNDAIIREREAAMAGISSQIGEVHQIFVDLAGLVSEQGGQVDDIESNIDRAKQRTENAIGQIRRAEKKGKKGRCNIFFVTGLAALAVLVLFIVMMA